MVDWLDDKYRTKPCAVLHSRDGNRSKFRTQTQPGPDIWNVSFCSGRGISPFCNRVWALDKTIWTETLAIYSAPALGARDDGGSNIVPLIKRNHKKGFSYDKVGAITQPGLDLAESRLGRHVWVLPVASPDLQLTRALLGLWIFHRLLGGRLNAPPMISAPGRRREKRKAAFESSRKIISKSFRSFLAQVKIGVSRGQNSKIFQNGCYNIKSLI